MAKRWYFKFKTFQGHTCEVDIYDENFSGTAIELNKDVSGSPGCPADNPLVIEEDNSDNILNNVRVKTGYINLIELTSGGLRDMHPSENGELEVYAFIDKPSNVDIPSDDADQYIIFHGYIQAQSFEQDYISYRDKVKLPIQSVMGVLQEREITSEEIAINRVLFEDFQEYKYLVFPHMLYDTNEESDLNILSMEIAKACLSPNNPEYDFGVEEYGETESPYAPLTIGKFTQKMCDAFGLISHDVGNMIVFTKIGWTGDYRKYALEDLYSDPDDNYTTVGSGSSINNFSSYFDYADDKSKESHVFPLHRITASWMTLSFPLKIDLTMFHESQIAGHEFDYVGYQIISSIWLGSGGTTYKHVTMQGDGEEWLNVVSNEVDASLFRCFFETPNERGSILRLKAKDGYQGYFKIAVYSEGYWYNFEEEGDEWVSNPTYKILQFTNNECEQHIGNNGKRVTVYFYHNSGATLTYNLTDIELDWQENSNKYYYPSYLKDKRVFKLSESSVEEAEIDFNFQYFGYGSFSTPSFQYLGINQRNLTLDVRKKTTASITELQLLLGKFAMSSNDQSNRVISTRHYVRDDEYELQVMGNQYF